MVTQEQLEQWERDLRSKVPLLGPRRRRAAVAALEANRNEAEVVSLLVEAARGGDPEVAARGDAALGDLSSQAAIDRLCAIWAESRDDRLGKIIAERRYVASQPPMLRLLSAFKAGGTLREVSAGDVPAMVSLLEDRDATIQATAERQLRDLPRGPAQDALCEQALQNLRGPVAKLCLEEKKRPSDPEQAALFLFVTRQLDAYFAEDFDFQNLRLAYDRANDTVRSYVMEVVRSGDRRCLGFFGGGRKALSECNEGEIKLAIESALRHTDWPRLFRAFRDLPLMYGFPLIDRFRESGWEPEEPELKSVLHQVLDDADGVSLPPPKEPSATSSLFEQWLSRGREEELARLSQQELLKRLDSATPPEGVSLVAALSEKIDPGSEGAQKVLNSPHWPVRLAGYACGMSRDLASDTVEDSNYWVKELAQASGVLEVWPCKSTPADLEELSSAPAEAWTGRLGAARKVLRTLMGHRITTGVMEEMVVEAGEFAGEFEEAG